eukprot:TRINITY_DN2226_c0_g1_i4.p1 TRINITY_DN2226_c0_g1~~TRINITY_DN2226_c0_g1_i4.p1  ORF type:complete len:454 (+),score=130.76 TRINITY_DN2226_c0_g1_i4:111-1364(+)
MRAAAALVFLVAGAAAQIDVEEENQYANWENSCGNCWVRNWYWQPASSTTGAADWVLPTTPVREYCVTGVMDQHLNTGSGQWPGMPTKSNTTASAWTISQIKAAFDADSSADFNELFCADYLGGYKDGLGTDETNGYTLGDTPVMQVIGSTSNSTASQLTYGPDKGRLDRSGTGAACVRAKTVAAVRQADAEARQEYIKWGSSGVDAIMGGEAGPDGTPNGYASAYAVAKGDHTWQTKKWGTGHDGADVPSNWCGVYMKKLFCHVAFPQVSSWNDTNTNCHPSTSQNCGANNNVETDTDLAVGRVRPADWGDCKALHEVCARRQPEDGVETNSGFRPKEAKNTFADWLARTENPTMTGELKAGRICDYWRLGFGLAKAGTGVATERTYDTARFGSSAGRTAAALLLPLAAAAAVLSA